MVSIYLRVIFVPSGWILLVVDLFPECMTHSPGTGAGRQPDTGLALYDS